MSKVFSKLFGTKRVSNQDIDKVTISLASPEMILSWSSGEVKKPETFNYRTLKPEPGGLFCEKLFGPVQNYECTCGKYKRIKYRGIVCERCGVEVTHSSVRRERMAHIKLASPVAHIWFARSMPSRIGLVLDISMKDIEDIISFEKHIVVDGVMTDLKVGQILTDEEKMDIIDEHGEDSVTILTGAGALKEMLINIDISNEIADIREELKSLESELKRTKLVRRLKILENFSKSNLKPEWMIIDILPVLPPELRPLVPLDGGRFATSDLNDLYRRVINRNNRLTRLINLNAPDIILRNEKRMLQEAVDALFDNGRRGRVISGTNKRPLKSLSGMLKGKQGRFRQNLLGKRVDYSGRSVIVVGPTLKLHECGLPKKMALELFKPFVFSRLERYGLTTTIKGAKRMVESERDEIWDILEEVIREHPVLLNRAPTLHRLGIQAFEPKLIEGKAIQLHPLVCTAYNADFDGDQMAVHIPLSLEAQLEARVLMMATNNILTPASGKPIIVPTRDVIMGIYYLTLEEEVKDKKDAMLFYHLGEVEHALEEGGINLHTPIYSFYKNIDSDGNEFVEKHLTTAGRMIFSNIMPKHSKIKFNIFNKVLRSKDVSQLIDLVYRYCGQKKTVIFADKLMLLGFKYATLSGISFGKDDLIIPNTKESIIKAAHKQVADFESQYADGLITRGEKYNKVIDVWSQCSDMVANDMMKSMETDKRKEGIVNPVFMMSDSGARGSKAQMKQLAGMRGLMAKPNEEIIETPILSNFKEGLSVLEYFTSTHGVRKGLVDMAIKTANSGYLTRRLVDVAQDVTVVTHDCGSTEGITVEAVEEGSDTIVSLSEKVLGRVVVNDINDMLTNELIIKQGELIDEDLIEKLEGVNIDSIDVRSVLTCKLDRGVCAMCYGRDLAKGHMVDLGEAVGIMAAQSIGEPGTQLTMRTFHSGGTAQKRSEKSSVEAPAQGIVRYTGIEFAKNSKKENIVLNRTGEICVELESGRKVVKTRLAVGSRLLFADGAKVSRGDKIAIWDPYNASVIANRAGLIEYHDLIAEVSVRETMNEETGLTQKVVIETRRTIDGGQVKPRIIVKDSKGKEVIYYLPVGTIIVSDNNTKVAAGDVLARMPRELAKTKDITGGLPRVGELFEARRPKDSAIIAEIDGTVSFGPDFKGKRSLVIMPKEEEANPAEYLIPKGSHVVVFEGDVVSKGDILVEGSMNPHDLLQVMGIKELANYLTHEVQEVYRLQGVRINEKHIEVIILQMLRKVEVTFTGESTYIVGEEVDKIEFYNTVSDIKDKGGEIPTARTILQGITRASLRVNSFLSAASFQETSRVLSDAAIANKFDNLSGLKESIIVGKLIPVGTGFVYNNVKSKAVELDQQEIDESVNNGKECVEEVKTLDELSSMI